MPLTRKSIKNRAEDALSSASSHAYIADRSDRERISPFASTGIDFLKITPGNRQI
jgi:hypothetical protein